VGVDTSPASDCNTNPYWDTARNVCTPKQYDMLELRKRHGLSLRTIALATGSSLSTVRGHLEGARRRIDRALRDEVQALESG
jgi:DNA-directed RNA polymerase specialized sigma24 family protein